MKKQAGFSILIVVGLIVVLSIVAALIPSIVGFSNKQIQLQRAEASALILEMNIRGVLDNPRSYTSISPTFVLEPNLQAAILASTRPVPGMICDDSSIFCNVGVRALIPTPTGYRIEIQLNGASNTRMLRTFTQEGPQLSGSDVIQCDDPNLPVFTGISSAGVAQCRSLGVTTCGNNQYVTGIRPDMTPLCQTLPDTLFSSAADKFISSTSFQRLSSSDARINLTSADKHSEFEMISGGEDVVMLKPVEFEPRSGRVNNVNYLSGPLYHSDASSVKCPDEYPEIKITSQTLQESLPGLAKCTTEYTYDKKAVSIKCSSPNSSNRVKLTVNHECRKGSSP